MNLYQISELENEIEALAAENNGEIDEARFGQLVVAQTQAVGKLEKLCQFLANLEAFWETAKLEEARIAKKRKSAEKMAENIKRYITPYIASKGKMTVGTFQLSIRQSKAVNIVNEDNIPAKFFKVEVIEKTSLDKRAVREAVESGENVPGAILEIRDNLQIK